MSKQAQILRFLQEGNTLTGLEAWRLFGIYRLAVPICRLRKQGWNIRTEKVLYPDGWYARYRLENKTSDGERRT